MNPELKITFFSGKGGVGKSTIASAYALFLSSQEKKTLLVSTDLAHSLGNIFKTDIGGNATRLRNDLWGLEIDPKGENKRYIEQVKGSLKGLVKAKMEDEVNRLIQLASVSPGAEEAALFDAMVTIVLDEGLVFDRIVFDTAPTGHAIRLLSLPEMMSVWIEGMLNRRTKVTKDYSQLLGDGEILEDPVYDLLNKRKQRYAAAKDIIMDANKTEIAFVLIPEKLPIMETQAGLHLLTHYSIKVDTLLVNKILPGNITDPFFIKRKRQQVTYIDTIKKTFEDQDILLLPLLEEDVTTLQALEDLSNYLTRSKVLSMEG